MKTEKRRVRISTLKYAFDVRVEGNDSDNVEQMATILRNGGTLPPPVTNQKTPPEIVEGRQRLEAHKRVGNEEIDIIVREFASRQDEIIFAMQAQLGTPVPLTAADIRYNLRHLLKLGTSRSRLVDIFSANLPREVAVRYVDDALKVLNRENVGAAINDVLAGKLSITKALEVHAITKEQYDRTREYRRAKGPKGKGIATPAQIKSSFGISVGTISKKVETISKTNLKDLRDELRTPKEAMDIAKHVYEKARVVFLRAEDYLTRTETACNSGTMAAGSGR